MASATRSDSKPTAVIQPSRNRLFFLQHSSVFEHFGGAEYYVDDLVSMAYATYGAQNVRAITPVEGKPIVTRPYSSTFVARAKAPLIRKWQNRLFFSLLRQASQIVREFRPSLIVNSHVSFGPLAYWLHRRYRIPFVTVVYGIDAWGNLWPQDEWCLRRATEIWSISGWTKDILIQRGINEKKIHVIYPRLSPGFEKPVSSRDSNQSEVRFLTVARLDAKEQYKGHDHVLEALAILTKTRPHLKLKYVIQGDGTDLARLKALTQKLNLVDTVEFRSSVKNREELGASYEDADVFIMPSRFGRWNGAWRGEGFGIVYVEAAAYGVPSIAYRCGGAVDIISDQKTGWLIEPDNILALSQAIEKAATDLPLVRRLGEQAREWVMNRFTQKPVEAQFKTAVDAVSN